MKWLWRGPNDRAEQHVAHPEQAHRPVPVRAGLLGLLRRAGNAAAGGLLGRERGGRPLDPALRAAMERGFGVDLHHVRLHQDPAAQAAAGVLEARALTHGEDVLLAADAPAPESPAGAALVAHEIAHVVQQRTAAAIDADRVSEPGDPSERAAEGAAERVMQGGRAGVTAGGTAAAVHRQRRQQGVPRAEAEAALVAFLQRWQTAQGRERLDIGAIRWAVERMFVGDVGALLRLDALWSRPGLPRDPAGLARAVARLLPETVDPERLRHLGIRHEGPSRVERVADLARRTAPAEPPPEMQAAQQRADQEARELRRGEGAIGPYSVDVLRAGRIIGGLGEAWRGPAAASVEARAYPAVEQAVAQIAADALIPAEARGEGSSSYAEARDVARDLARRLDIAQQRNSASVELRLGGNYDTVWDRAAMIAAVERIVLLVRDALPHHATAVNEVTVFFGDRWVRSIRLHGAPR